MCLLLDTITSQRSKENGYSQTISCRLYVSFFMYLCKLSLKRKDWWGDVVLVSAYLLWLTRYT